MGIKRYTAIADTTITNAFKPNLTSRATGSNMGLSDSLEVFRIYGQESSSSAELSRVLIKFPVTGANGGSGYSIKTDRDNGVIPASGSVSFYLRLFNAPHPFTLPRDYNLTIAAGSRSWDEGTGLDMEAYSDSGSANWSSAVSSSSGVVHWGTAGGDFHTTPKFSAYVDKGPDDLEVEITWLVEEWISGSTAGAGGSTLGKENDGVWIYLTNESAYSSSYTKKYFARDSEFFFKRPVIEARWESAKKDNRGNFYYSSSLAPAADNLNILYLYNYVRGRLRDIPGLGGDNKIYVSLYSGSGDNTVPTGSALRLSKGGGTVTNLDINATGSKVSTGIYSCSLALTAASTHGETTLTKIFDIWHTSSDGVDVDVKTRGGTIYHTGAITPVVLHSSDIKPYKRYACNITNLRHAYYKDETVQFRVYTRERDWNPNIYSKAVATPVANYIDSASFKVIRIVDELDVIAFGTGSDRHTHLSYDLSGSYFDLDMALLQPGYAYGIKFAFYDPAVSTWNEYPDVFKFRVEE